MTVVIDLDPLRRFGKLEQVSNLLQQFALRRAFGEAAIQRLDCIARCLLDKPNAIAALGANNFDLAARPFGQRFGQKRRLWQVAVEQDCFWRRYFLIELGKEAGQDLFFRQVLCVGREECAMPPILATANEEGLDAHLPGLGRQRKNISIANA